MISFAILLVFGGCMAWLISGVSIDDAASVKWLYVVFTIGYIVFLTIVNLIKFFVKFSKNYKNNH
jgi:heme/copper-type cytochrome/quinol oxidase subunit 2